MKTCTICGAKYDKRPALSREDNKTEICPDCGVKAMATGNRWAIEKFNATHN